MNTSQFGGIFTFIIYVVIFAAIFYFLIVLPQRRRAQERAEMISNVRVGDEIMTAGGIIGTIKDIKDDIVILQLENEVSAKLSKEAIVMTLSKEEGTKAA